MARAQHELRLPRARGMNSKYEWTALMETMCFYGVARSRTALLSCVPQSQPTDNGLHAFRTVPRIPAGRIRLAISLQRELSISEIAGPGAPLIVDLSRGACLCDVGPQSTLLSVFSFSDVIHRGTWSVRVAGNSRSNLR